MTGAQAIKTLFWIAVLMYTMPGWSQLRNIEKVISQSNLQMATALKEGDAATYASFFSKDAINLFPGVTLNGRSAIFENQRRVFGKVQVKEAEIKTQTVDLHGDQATEIGTFTFTYLDLEKLQTWTAKGRYLAVWRRQKDGSWKIHADAGIPDP